MKFIQPTQPKVEFQGQEMNRLQVTCIKIDQYKSNDISYKS